ncbi:MAG TPA: diheme cytochrome c [Burkholderiales bacterium]|jgi:hypothetical protein|nr:diheme cytochrome c [Burkholderiales bacterium]
MRTIPLALCLLWLAAAAFADEARFTASNPAWKTECGSCHVAYPPPLLPARSWRTIMARLDRHFGADASVDPQTAAQIERFLVANAGQGRGPSVAEPRITEAAWFVREHDAVPPALWKRPQVKSPANCGACHTRAELGDYSERTLRMPR